jgi:DNA-directed RNA polymerase specialized sigma24 family protein
LPPRSIPARIAGKTLKHFFRRCHDGRAAAGRDAFADQGLDLVGVHEALDRLAGLHQRQSQVVTLRYLGGMIAPEIAAALEVSVGIVERDRRIARARLSNELGEGVG